MLSNKTGFFPSLTSSDDSCQILQELRQQPFNLELKDKELEAMRSFQEQLMSPPVLTLLYAERRMTLDRDNCGVQVGCVFLTEKT